MLGAVAGWVERATHHLMVSFAGVSSCSWEGKQHRQRPGSGLQQTSSQHWLPPKSAGGSFSEVGRRVEVFFIRVDGSLQGLGVAQVCKTPLK